MEENKNGGGGGRRDNRGQDRRDSFNKSGHDAFKKKEKVSVFSCNMETHSNDVSCITANLQGFQHH